MEALVRRLAHGSATPAPGSGGGGGGAESFSASLEGLSLAGWASFDDLLEYRREKLASIDTEIGRVMEEAVDAAARVKALEDALRELSADSADDNGGGASRAVVVTLFCAAREKVLLRVRYVVGGASWRPSYSLRASGGGGPQPNASSGSAAEQGSSAVLTYEAQVQQSTGEHWRGVALKLSTARPWGTGPMAELPPLTIGFWEPPTQMTLQPQRLTHARRSAVPQPLAVSAMSTYSEPLNDAEATAKLSDEKTAPGEEFSELEAALLTMPITSVAEGTTASVFAVERPAAVPSDGAWHKVVLAQLQLAAEFDYQAVPRAAAVAYLGMRATNPGPFVLLPGSVKVRPAPC